MDHDRPLRDLGSSAKLYNPTESDIQGEHVFNNGSKYMPDLNCFHQMKMEIGQYNYMQEALIGLILKKKLAQTHKHGDCAAVLCLEKVTWEKWRAIMCLPEGVDKAHLNQLFIKNARLHRHLVYVS